MQPILGKRKAHVFDHLCCLAEENMTNIFKLEKIQLKNEDFFISKA